MILDLSPLSIALGFQFGSNVAQIICMIVSICIDEGLADKR